MVVKIVRTKQQEAEQIVKIFRKVKLHFTVLG